MKTLNLTPSEAAALFDALAGIIKPVTDKKIPAKSLHGKK